MTVAVPADEFEKAFSDRLKRLSKKVKLDGFRPGKVPLKIVEAQYGGRVMEEVAGDLIQTSFQEAVGQEGLEPAGGATIEPKNLGRGEGLEYVATFEVYPEVEKLDIADVRIERPVCEIQPGDVDRTLETMRQQRVQWRAVDRAAAEGDRLIIDFKGSLDDKPFEGGAAEDFVFVLGSGTLVEGLEKQLVGVKAGEAQALTVEFPRDYRNEALAGREVRFDVSVKTVAEPELPELDEEFARSFGIKDGSLDALRAEVKENQERELEDRIQRVLRDRVMRALLDANRFDIPKRLLDEEVQRLIQASRETFKRHGASPDLAPTDPAVYEKDAHRRVALGLILAEVAKANGIHPDPARVRAVLNRMAASYEDPEAFVKWHYADSKHLTDVQAMVLEETIVERLLEKAEVVDVQVAFGDLMYSKQAADNEARK